MIEQWLWVYAGIEKHALNNTELQVTEHKNGNEGFGLLLFWYQISYAY